MNGKKLSEEDRERLEELVDKAGVEEAARRLAVSPPTVYKAVSGAGRLTKSIAALIHDRLDDEDGGE